MAEAQKIPFLTLFSAWRPGPELAAHVGDYLVTGAVISVTGLISFVGLLAPHIARLLTGSSRFSTTVLSGLCGSILLLLADVLARSIGGSEVPISIVTSLLGAPFLFWLMCKRGRAL